LLVFNYDEWGGFFDHVPPPTAPIPEADALAGNKDGLLGFRVPCVVVSPYAQREHVSSLVLDHTSILRLIEWRWGLDPLTERDATANNLADVLDFRRPSLRVKQFRVPTGPFGRPCPGPSTRAAMTDEWELLRAKAAGFGWPV
jgi:phospholipase C